MLGDALGKYKLLSSQNSEMKLPFNKLLNPIMKPYFGESRMLCQHSTFAMSIFYTYIYGTIGFFINVNHLRKHLGELPVDDNYTNNEFMVVHDLKIIATSMGVVQYACLLVGCFTENPALFLPHLAAQLLIVLVKILNLILQLFYIQFKTFTQLRNKIFAILFMSFNWCQEFCVFRRFLCICDL